MVSNIFVALYIANAQKKKKLQCTCLSGEGAVKREDIKLLTRKLSDHDSSFFCMRHETKRKSSTFFFSLAAFGSPTEQKNPKAFERNIRSMQGDMIQSTVKTIGFLRW
jgi:hypothetical protein